MNNSKLISIFSIIVLLFLSFGCLKKNKGLGVKPENRKYFGVYKRRVSIKEIKSIRKQYKGNLQIVAWPIDWAKKFPVKTCVNIIQQKAIPFILWNPVIKDYPEAAGFEAILRDDWLEYLEEWAEDVKEYQYPVFICFAPDFNNNERDWFIKDKQGSEKMKAVYKKIVMIFKEKEVENAIWVFSPSFESSPGLDWQIVEKAYPGDKYIDWLGFSALVNNNLDDKGDNKLSSLICNSIENIQKISSKKPIVVSCLGVAEKDSLNKEESLFLLPNILKNSKKALKALIWHDVSVNAVEYGLNSSKKVELAAKEVISSDLFSADVEKLNTVHLR
jgi:hypothetical protein